MVDLPSSDIVTWIRLERVVRELYNVAFLSGVRQPSAIGFKTNEVTRLISIDES